MFGDFKSKVLSSFRKIKKDMVLLSRSNKSLSRDVRSFSRKVSSIDSLKRSNAVMQKEMNLHSRMIQKMMKSGNMPQRTITSINPELNSRISKMRSELRTEIESLKYEISKSSENSYQAYSDSILVQREIEYLKKENKILRDEMMRRQEDIEKNLTKELNELNNSILSVSESLSEMRSNVPKPNPNDTGIYSTPVRESGNSVDYEINLLKSRILSIERNSGEHGPIQSQNHKSQQTIFSFAKKPFVKMFARKSRSKKKENAISIEVPGRSGLDKSSGMPSASSESSESITYMPQPWSKISGYKKVERKDKSNGYFW